MLGYSITSPPLVVKDKVIVGVAGGEYGDPRLPRRLRRRERQARLALLHDPGAGRARQRHLEGRQLEDRRRADVADRLLRSRAEHALLDGRQSRARRSIARCAATGDNLYQQLGRRARPGHRPAASGTTSSRRTTATTGTRRRTWCSSIAPGTGSRASCCCTPIATASSTCSIASRGSSSRARRSSIRTGTTGSTRRAAPSRSPNSNSSPEGTFLVYPTLVGGTNCQSPSYSPLTGWFYLEYRRGRPAVHERAGDDDRRPAVHRAAAGRRGRPRPGRTIPASTAGIKALDPGDRQDDVDFKLLQGSLTNGVLATARERALRLDPRRQPDRARREDRHAPVALPDQRAHAASPMSYAIDGRQYVALAAGNVIVSFALVQ